MKLLSDKEIRKIWYSNPASTLRNKDNAKRAIAQAQLDSDKKALNHWQDKPDSEGWWWFMGKIYKDYSQTELYQSWEEPYSVYILASNWIGITKYKGKWCKAYVPEMKELEERR